MSITCRCWRNLTARQTGSAVPFGRSSHSVVSLAGNRVAVFGGEHEPRHPIDNVVHVLDVASARWTQLTPDQGPVPTARVGHAAASVGNRFYVFGGRTGVDQHETSLGDFWEFDASAIRWRQIEAGAAPRARSYHVMASHGNRVYVFGGCGADGRLNDLFAFDTEKQEWEELTSPEQPPVRGGPALFATRDKIYVFGGFCGKEMDDFWAYDLQARKWEPVQAEGERPSARSVTAFATLDEHRLFLFGGEVDPSTQGHAGAGDYSAETFIFDTRTLTWTKESAEGEERPTPRGWLAGAGLEGGNFLLFGGFDGKDRVNDLYLYQEKA